MRKKSILTRGVPKNTKAKETFKYLRYLHKLAKIFQLTEDNRRSFCILYPESENEIWFAHLRLMTRRYSDEPFNVIKNKLIKGFLAVVRISDLVIADQIILICDYTERIKAEKGAQEYFSSAFMKSAAPILSSSEKWLDSRDELVADFMKKRSQLHDAYHNLLKEVHDPALDDLYELGEQLFRNLRGKDYVINDRKIKDILLCPNQNRFIRKMVRMRRDIAPVGSHKRESFDQRVNETMFRYEQERAEQSIYLADLEKAYAECAERVQTAVKDSIIASMFRNKD